MRKHLRYLTFVAVSALYVSKITTFSSCEISLLTLRIVDKCPEDRESWERAAEKLNCASITQSCAESVKLMGPPLNTKNYIFQYHCVINAWRNETLEVCALNRTILGFCAEFNRHGAVIQDNYDADCKQHTPPCPHIYNSADAYKYPSCYEMTKRNRNTHSMGDKFYASSSSRTVVNAVIFYSLCLIRRAVSP